MASRHLIMSGALALTVSSCAHQPATPPASMWQHYQRVGEIHYAVVQGNIGEAKAVAGWFIGRESVAGPTAWVRTLGLPDAFVREGYRRGQFD